MADPGANDQPPTIHSQATNPKASDATERQEAGVSPGAASGSQADDGAKIGASSQEPETIGYAQSLEPTEASEGEHAKSRSRFFGDYELLAPIARGGMGMVYKARQRKLNRIVALKMILAGSLASQEEVQRFQTEAEAAAQLDHPGIVPIFEVGEHEGQQFFSMAFVEGGSLSARVRERPLPPDQAAGIVKQIAEAVAYAHERGIIHRDLKPSNVLLDKHGTPKVTDFGLAKQTLGESQLTTSGQVLGTPSYMPPEQAAGSIHAVGPASDIYSLGAVLYCLLTGRPPFQAANSVETLKQVLEQEPVPVRQLNQAVDRDLETICLKCLRKEPGQRYATGLALAEDLRRYLAKEPIQARPLGRAERLARWCRRNPVVASLIGGIGLSLVLGAAISIYFAVVANREAALARASEAQTKKEKLLGDRRLYVAEMNLTHQAWHDAQLALVKRRLADQAPKNADAPDLRGFEWHYLSRLCQLDLRTFRGHTGEVLGVAFSPDGRRLASAGADNSVKVWDATTGQEVFSLPGHTEKVHSVAFCPKGNRLASAAEDQLVKIWDAATGKEIRTLTGHTGPVWTVAFSPDGLRLAAAQTNVARNGDFAIKIWDAQSGKEIRTIPGYPTLAVNLAFSPDGRCLASAYADGRIAIWDTRKGHELRSLRGHTGSVISVSYHPGGRRLASASSDKTIKLWDLTTGETILTLRGHAEAVWSVAYSPDGRRLASGSQDRTVRIWDADSGVETLTLRGHTGEVMEVAYSPDGRRLASGSLDQTVKLWDATAGLESITFTEPADPVQGVAFHPNGRWLAAGSSWFDLARLLPRAEVTIWDAATGQVVHTLQSNADPVTSLAYSPDGLRLAAASGLYAPEVLAGEIKVWDTATQQVVHTLTGHAGPVWSVAYSRDGRWLASASEDKTVRIWDAATGKEIHKLLGHTRPVWSVAFSPDSQRLASGSQDGTVKIWDAVKTKGTGPLESQVLSPLFSLPSGTEMVRGLAFHPDGVHLAVAGKNPAIEVWDTITKKPVLPLVGHSSQVFALAFSPDGQRLASAGNDRTVILWDMATGQSILKLPGHTAQVRCVAFSQDGRRLASAGTDRTVKIWDATASTDELLVQREARSLVRFWFGKPLLRPEAIAKIRSDTTVTAAERELALALATHFPEDTQCLVQASRAVLRRPDADAAQHGVALAQAEAAYVRADEDGSVILTLAAARYRVGRYQEAIHWIDSSARFLRDPQPIQLAILAMAHHRLGHAKLAKASLDQLRTTMQNPAWANDEEARALLVEAEGLLGKR